jgi:hypothetical protein
MSQSLHMSTMNQPQPHASASVCAGVFGAPIPTPHQTVSGNETTPVHQIQNVTEEQKRTDGSFELPRGSQTRLNTLHTRNTVVHHAALAATMTLARLPSTASMMKQNEKGR